MSFSCKKCLDEGFDFGPKAVQIACCCDAGKRWLHRYAPNAQALPEYKPSEKAGVNEKGGVRRFWGECAPQWPSRYRADADFWVRSSSGHYGVIRCRQWNVIVPLIGDEYPGDQLIDVDGNPTPLYYVGPFDPDRPDLDPPEVRQ